MLLFYRASRAQSGEFASCSNLARGLQRHLKHGLAALLIVFAGMPIAAAQAADPASELQAALTQWTADFNAGNKEKVCGIFAPDLRYDYRGFPERGFAEICATLQRSL